LETYLPELLFALLSICFLIQLYFVIGQNKLARYKSVEELPQPGIPVSVIISARNEEKNLIENLPSILSQDYPDFEVIVVNDCSYDATASVLLEFKEAYPNLKIITVQDNDKYRTGKKFALTLGIKGAKNEHLLFTDADCVPASPNWITRMAANFKDEVAIVLGFSPYKKEGNIINPLIRFETIKTAINYFSSALKGDAYMGVGRNLAYTKTLFFNKKGFASHMQILSGDDDIFVNENATSTNTAIEIHPDSFMFTTAKTSLGDWFRQKRRHSGAGKFYKAKHRFALSMDAITGLGFYAFLTACLFLNFLPIIAGGLFIFRLIFQLIIYRKLFKQFGSYYLLFYLPFLDIVYYIYLNIFGLVGASTKNKQWK
jgi:cellulose synthase/poly-beta-1,6-N-acetylglucosamine synthase-like glycosyltransferase